MKMKPKVSIDSIDRYHRYKSVDPSPIVPIYAYPPPPVPQWGFDAYWGGPGHRFPHQEIDLIPYEVML